MGYSVKKINGQSPSESVCASLQSSLLNRIDKYSQKKDLTRTQVISKAVRRFLAAELGDDPDFWDAFYDRYEEDGKL